MLPCWLVRRFCRRPDRGATFSTESARSTHSISVFLAENRDASPPTPLRPKMPSNHACRSELAPGGVPTMVVNDNAGILMPLGVVEFIASKLAPTVSGSFSLSDDPQTGAEIKQRPSCGECTDSKAPGKAPRSGMATNAVERVASARCKEPPMTSSVMGAGKTIQSIRSGNALGQAD